MLVSDSRKLVFVHIQKTGGSTVDRLLEEHVPDVYRLGARHQFARRGRKKLDAWDEYFKFAFVRNPWARLVSWYGMIEKFRGSGKRPWNKQWRYVYDNSSNFEEFIRNCTDEVQITRGVRYSFTYNQLDYLTDEDGRIIVDFIGRLESFDEDVRGAFGRFGVELEKVPHKNRSRHAHYSEMYTPETEQIVRERFARDIEHFGYEFERPRRGGPGGSLPKRERDVPAGLLFVCGCDRSGTTTFADYLNRHPEVLVCQERFKATKSLGEIEPGLFTPGRILDFRPGETENPIWKNGRDFFVDYHRELLARKDPAALKWVGDKNPNYVRRMELVAGNNPGARFIILYRPVEEVAASWEARAKDPDDHWRGDRGAERAVETWNLSLRKTREFVEASPLPTALVVGYHDFVSRTEAVASMVAAFLGIEPDASATRAWAEGAREFGKDRRPRAGLTPAQRSLVLERADRGAEAWVLDRIEKQWKDPSLYARGETRAALVSSLNALEARSWRLGQRVGALEHKLALRDREFEDLTGSRTWRLLNRIDAARKRAKRR